MAAQAEPDDCGRLPPFASFSESSSEAVSVPCRATVISAPILVSRNGETDCLTDTPDAPFAFWLEDQDASAFVPAFAAPLGAGLPLRAGAGRVDASTLSWLQSSLLTSTPFIMSASLASGAAASAAGASASSSSAGGVC